MVVAPIVGVVGNELENSLFQWLVVNSVQLFIIG